ncbi:MAG: hypothetical protein GY827_04655 [Cytophagales bacterium]|nr:hypothetical protein [Cytophagales bacterium]
MTKKDKEKLINQLKEVQSKKVEQTIDYKHSTNKLTAQAVISFIDELVENIQTNY